MNSKRTLPGVAGWTLALGVLGLTATVAAQDEKPAAVVEEEDLGDGFRAVSVNGGPPAIIDDQTGLILKQVYGRPAIVNKEAGAILYLGKDGEPEVKFYGGKGGGKAPKKLDPKMLDRMKAFMRRAQKHRKAMGRLGGKGKRAAGKKKKARLDPERLLKARLELTLKMLGVAGEESEVILRPRLEAVLRKQDQIRRSTVELVGVRTKKGPAKPSAAKRRSDDLPPAIRSFLGACRVHLRGKGGSPLQKGLAAYRAARKKQGVELEALRKKLREVLTRTQEAALVAVGALD